MRGAREPDRAEELANSATHAFGLVLSLAGLSTLMRVNAPGVRSADLGSVGCLVYGISLVLLYAASTLYHGCRHAELKRVLLVLDHVGIYVLIAGTYTPLALIALRGPLGWGMLATVWTLAVLGGVAKMVRAHRIDEDSPLPYLAMSWMALATFSRIAAQAPPGVLAWLLAGGMFYTSGLVFFVQHDRRFHHAIWHLFVLAGSICHYRAVLGFALPLLS